MAAADAGIAAAYLDECEARFVLSRSKIVVAAIYATIHDSRAAACRHPQAFVAETSDRLLHRDVEPLGNPTDLFPQRRRISLERPLLCPNVEPPRQSHPLAEKCLTLTRRGKGISLSAANVVRGAATLRKADAERLGSGRHRDA